MAEHAAQHRHDRGCAGYLRADEAHNGIDARHDEGNHGKRGNLDDVIEQFEKLSPAEQVAQIERANEYLRGLSADQLQQFLNGAAE
jgi:hypothetical protein